MKNFPVKVDGKVYWISRSVATVGFVFKLVGNTIYTLIEKRGKGAADNVDSYCVPCGYIDYDETGEECNKDETRLIIYPVSPYGKKNYTVEVNLACGFDK